MTYAWYFMQGFYAKVQGIRVCTQLEILEHSGREFRDENFVKKYGYLNIKSQIHAKGYAV